jgi:hypothetical protein
MWISFSLQGKNRSTAKGFSWRARAHEVAAVTRRLIEGLLERPDNCPVSIAKAFESQMAVKAARTKLRTGNNPHRAIGVDTIRAYLGQALSG